MDLREAARARTKETGSSRRTRTNNEAGDALRQTRRGPRALLLTLWLYSRLSRTLPLFIPPLFLPYLSTCLNRGPSLSCTWKSRGFPRVNQVVDFLPDRFVEPRNEEERRGA